MIITPEKLADLIFSISQLRYYEKECKGGHPIDEVRIIITLQRRVDDILKTMGMQDFLTREQIIQILKLNSQHENAA